MNSWVLAGVSFVAMFGGCLFAIFVARRLAEHHVSKETQDTVKLGVGMVAAMSSLILGLMTASVKENFDSTDKDVHTYALNVLSLATDLRHYGPEACPAQDLLAQYVHSVLTETWGLGHYGETKPEPGSDQLLLSLDNTIRNWTPTTDLLKETRTAAMSDMRSILTTRWAVSEEAVASVPTAFLVVLVAWLALIFISFGLFAPPNAVVIVSFFLCAASISGALFLIMEMSGPFEGIIAVQPQPMEQVLDFIKVSRCK
ncbi:hypothetical protein ABLE91_09860 [Aquabacter sp. CN5-332]|uniref:bestrophin-like domain n=1 Tax=Aquabacter sp. CN5-332 TaxID=3156608 RepID=UPI0032B3F23D